MKILVTGSNGQLGFDCIKEMRKEKGYEILPTTLETMDITDEQQVEDVIKSFLPDVIIHCAAWTAVDSAEKNYQQAYNVNFLGTKFIAKNCKKYNCKLVYISTDYVFDGKQGQPFETTDEKKGLSVYGKTKALAEDYIISNLEKYFIIRTSWVFGINGKNFVKTMIGLDKKGFQEVDVVSDQIGSVTYTKDLALLISSIIKTNKYGIYHATNEGFLSWADFAAQIFKSINSNVKVNYVSTNQYKIKNPNSVERPLNSRLSKKSLDLAGFSRLPRWENALLRFLEEIEK